MKKPRVQPFRHVRRCRGCRYWVLWRSEFARYFPTGKPVTCPHCGEAWEIEPRGI